MIGGHDPLVAEAEAAGEVEAAGQAAKVGSGLGGGQCGGASEARDTALVVPATSCFVIIQWACGLNPPAAARHS